MSFKVVLSALMSVSLLSLAAFADSEMSQEDINNIVTQQLKGQTLEVQETVRCMFNAFEDGSERVDLAEVAAIGTDRSTLADETIYAIVKPNGDLRCIGGSIGMALSVLTLDNAEMRKGMTAEVKAYGMVLGTIGVKGFNKDGVVLTIAPGKRFSNKDTAKGVTFNIRRDEHGEWKTYAGKQRFEKATLNVSMTAKGVNPVIGFLNPPKVTKITLE